MYKIKIYLTILLTGLFALISNAELYNDVSTMDGKFTVSNGIVKADGIILGGESRTNWPSTNDLASTNYVDHQIAIETNRAISAETNLEAQISANSNSIVALESPYQSFSANLTPIDGTVTVAYANGSLIEIIADTSPLTITFTNATYPTNGVNRVGIEILAGTNTIQFDTTVISNAVAPNVSTNNWTSLFFRKNTTNLWFGRQ